MKALRECVYDVVDELLWEARAALRRDDLLTALHLSALRVALKVSVVEADPYRTLEVVSEAIGAYLSALQAQVAQTLIDAEKVRKEFETHD
jgi:hypothetical protein